MLKHALPLLLVSALFSPPASARIDPEAVHAMPRGSGPSLGPANAKVTLVVGIELAEPFSRRLIPVLQALAKEFPRSLRVVFRSFVPVHKKNGEAAALAACAAHKQGRFFKMVDLLWTGAYDNGRDYSTANLNGLATSLGLNMKRYQADQRGDCKRELEGDQRDFKRFGIKGVPVSFINGRVLLGAQPITAFRALVTAELRRANRRLGARAHRRARDYYKKWILGKGKAKAQHLAEAPANAKPARNAGRPARPRRPRPDPATVYAVGVGKGSLVLGPPDALVTVVVASEFAEPFTKRLRPTLDALRHKYGRELRVVFRHYPVHMPNGENAALALCAAGEQGRFVEMEKLVWAKAWSARSYDPPFLESLAQQAGATPAQYKTDRDGACRVILNQDVAELKALGVSGVPSSYINGRVLAGAQPRAAFEGLIDEELTRARRRVRKSRRTTAKNYYRRWVLAKGKKAL